VTTVRLRAASEDDRPAVASLLAAASLPTDLDDWFPAQAVVAELAGRIVGAAGFERGGDAALLRSVAVAPEARGAGLGAALVAERLHAARRAGARRAFLLTTDAASWFARLGFTAADRATVPAPIAATRQFRALCPASAACLARDLETAEPWPPLRLRLAAEAIGTALLLAAVVGSGIMGERLAAGNAAIALLANTAATAAALYALILVLAPISGAHFNPAVTAALAWRGDLPWRDALAYAAVQAMAAIAGVALAHLMFEAPALLTVGVKTRAGWPQAASEFVATFGLVALIGILSARRSGAVPAAVACWIAAAYWFTASTSFANPAVTLARALTDSFAGIRPGDVPAFWLAQGLGTIAGALAARAVARAP
jgi:glycerol uptake facilitator-like aquaporin/N-acetylglutamate synthase-like GNAT family acetyltransferase